MGERLRESRHARGVSIRELAGRLGVSPSLISQVETGRASPSVATLYAMASELDISLDEVLFGARGHGARTMEGTRPEADGLEAVLTSGGPVQRGQDRKAIRLGSGVVWERLTTSSDSEAEFLYVTYEVGGASSPAETFQRHAGREWGYVLSGQLHVTIGFDDHILSPGDAIAFESAVPHRMWNDGEEPVHGIWFVLDRGGAGHRLENLENQA